MGTFTKDVRKYLKIFTIFQITHNQKFKKPFNKHITTKIPRDRYIVDISYIDDSINDTNYVYKYIIIIIDHYSKPLSSYLLKSKTSKEVLKYINKFICSYGIPKYIQSDNGSEFINRHFKKFCDDKNIKLIHFMPYHPKLMV